MANFKYSQPQQACIDPTPPHGSSGGDPKSALLETLAGTVYTRTLSLHHRSLGRQPRLAVLECMPHSLPPVDVLHTHLKSAG
jgi:hypothetical protein